MPPRKKKPSARELIESGKLTTATGKAQRMEKPPIPKDPFAAIAPVQPMVFPSSSTMRFDEFATTRNYNRANPQGESEVRFIADDFPVDEDQRHRIAAQSLTKYSDFDMLIEEERDAAYVDQPPEAIASYRRDLQNKPFINSIKGPVLKSGTPSTTLQRQVLLKQTHDARMARLAEDMARTSTKSFDPDFFTNLPGYVAARKRETAADEDNRTMLAAIDQEIQQVAEDDDYENREKERADRRADLEKERDELLATIARDKEEDARDGASKPPVFRDDATVPKIQALEAKQLLEVNPLVTLDSQLRTQFFQLAEPAQLWQTLMPLIYQHEPHRRHYNVVELLRAMNICGAKYDGCVKVRTPHRMSSLLDKQFYGSFLNCSGGLTGGHEHFREDDSTTMILFKFFLVRRTKDNSDVIAGKQADDVPTNTTSASTTTLGTGNKSAIADLTDENANDIDTILAAQNAHTQLFKAGLYDADEAYEQLDDDGTNEYGSFHDIRDLPRHFMFSMRLVCVDVPASEADRNSDGYASMDDGDFEPEDSSGEEEEAPAQPSSGHSSQRRQGLFSDNDGDRGSDLDEDDEPDENFLDAAAREDKRAFTHSDDERVEDAHTLAHRQALERKPFMPFDRLGMTWGDATKLVGKWKADDIFQKVNSGFFGPLCVRSFMFYASLAKD